jgi:DNA-binding Xre family transcriptional regulator
MSKKRDRAPTNDPRSLTSALKGIMQSAGYESYKQLSSQSGISLKQLRKIKKGQVHQVRLGILQTLAQSLQISFFDLLTAIAPEESALVQPETAQDFVARSPEDPLQRLVALQSEYEYLQQQQAKAFQQATLDCQTEALRILEPWLQYWPVAAKAAQENAAFQATKLVPLCRPIETLLERWQVNAIASIGSEISFDPQLHQLVDGEAEVGQLVKVRYPGYMHQGKLHFRAKVSPVDPIA